MALSDKRCALEPCTRRCTARAATCGLRFSRVRPPYTVHRTPRSYPVARQQFGECAPYQTRRVVPRRSQKPPKTTVSEDVQLRSATTILQASPKCLAWWCFPAAHGWRLSGPTPRPADTGRPLDLLDERPTAGRDLEYACGRASQPSSRRSTCCWRPTTQVTSQEPA